MRSVQVSKPKGPLEIAERDIPEPAPRQVRIKVQACGICHGDSITKEGLFPGIRYPRVPGHEVVGIIDSVGKDVTEWEIGQRVAVGWRGGHCGYCESCWHGDFLACSYAQVLGISYDGGYADYMVVPIEAIVSIPDELSFPEAAPLMCAGVTTYNALRNSGARAGDVVAVLRIGGHGHLGIQFASKMGFRTVAIERGKDKEELVRIRRRQTTTTVVRYRPGLEKLEGHVYIGRYNKQYNLPESKWHNPFVIGQDGTREEVIARYHGYLLQQEQKHLVDCILHELKDKVCWCKPEPCHGGVLAVYADNKKEN
jgi:D-arabinose 1-dehydrogenase-like Zn-dependent alcohol dehydrogenase